MRNLLAAGVLVSLGALALAVPALADVISDQAYVRHDGGADATTLDCSTNRRQQNEPSAAVSPTNPTLMVSGANDYCPVPTAGGTWAGFYYSSDGGSTWTNSLLPGYPTDTSAEGQASPLFRFVDNAGDPVQEWDNFGHLYYAGIAFNRTQPANGSIWLARYTWHVGLQPDYEFTTIVSRGASSPLFLGNFEDKVQLGVDRGASSPHSGNVYLCWARFNANFNSNTIFFARSEDGGRTFSIRPVSQNVIGNQFCDIAVTRSGHVYVAWRQFEASRGAGPVAQSNAVVFVKSTNGGRSFASPREIARFTAWDLIDTFLAPEAAGRAYYEACLAADSTPGACRGPEPRAFARDCGDGPFVCDSGYVFHRQASQVRITADPTPTGNPNAAYIVFDASVPGTETPTGTSFGTIEPGIGSQGSIYFTKTTNGGAGWTPPARIDPQSKGHQYFADLDANAGVLHAVYHDSRFDAASGPTTTPSGGDFRTVPFSNQWVAANPPGAVSSGPGLDTFYATSTDDGASWNPERVSAVSQMPQYEQFGFRDVPFHGDYNYVSAVGSTVLMAWTDQRDTIPGTDARYLESGDGTDGFDVFNCIVDATDPCANDGGLNQNIYGFVP